MPEIEFAYIIFCSVIIFSFLVYWAWVWLMSLLHHRDAISVVVFLFILTHIFAQVGMIAWAFLSFRRLVDYWQQAIVLAGVVERTISLGSLIIALLLMRRVIDNGE